jgi:hypothetical protein
MGWDILGNFGDRIQDKEESKQYESETDRLLAEAALAKVTGGSPAKKSNTGLIVGVVVVFVVLVVVTIIIVKKKKK